MAKLIENEVKGIQLKEGQTVLDVEGNEYLIEKGDVLQESSLQERNGDWRIPSFEELEIIDNCLRENPDKDWNFKAAYYWSSESSSDFEAWAFPMLENDRLKPKPKTDHLFVRVVRNFRSHSGYKIGQETPTGFIFDAQGDIIFECKKEDEQYPYSWDEAMQEFGA